MTRARVMRASDARGAARPKAAVDAAISRVLSEVCADVELYLSRFHLLHLRLGFLLGTHSHRAERGRPQPVGEMIAHAQLRVTAAPTRAGVRAAPVASRAPHVARVVRAVNVKSSVKFLGGSVAPSALRATPATSVRSRRACVTTHARYGSYDGGGGGMVPIPDRIVALLPYLVPLLDGLRYSRFFFSQFPQAIVLLTPLQPIASMYFRIPFAGLISFFAIYMGMAENRSLSRFVRFNAMQAIILDICLVLPGMIEYVLSPGRLAGAGFELYKLCYNSVWLFVLFAFALAAIGCLSGQTYKLPFIGDAADMRL